jgi:hypothetical protein
MSAPSRGIGRPCGLLPRWSRGISAHANAVNAADTRMSGARRLWKACSYRNEPTLSAKEGARLVTDIRTAAFAWVLIPLGQKIEAVEKTGILSRSGVASSGGVAYDL